MVPFDRTWYTGGMTIKPLIDAQLQHKPSIHSELTEQMPQIQTNVLFFFLIIYISVLLLPITLPHSRHVVLCVSVLNYHGCWCCWVFKSPLCSHEFLATQRAWRLEQQHRNRSWSTGTALKLPILLCFGLLTWHLLMRGMHLFFST